MELYIYNEIDGESYFKVFNAIDGFREAYHWITNHLDLSKKWSVEQVN